jgi:hypothetical protein
VGETGPLRVAAGWLLPVPAKVRLGKDDGDVVTVAVEVDFSRL